MKIRLVPTLAILALAAAACAPQPPVAPPSPSPSPTAVASPAAPGEPAPTASPAPSATPAGFSWEQGAPLKAYAFKGIGGVYFDPARKLLYVADATRTGATSPSYLLRKFQPDGTFISEIPVVPEGGEAPRSIDAMTFDQAGNPIFTHEDQNQAWRLLKLFTATVVTPGELPFTSTERAGTSALAAKGPEIRIAVQSLDPGTTTATGGQIQIGIGEEGEAPRAISVLADPLYPTVHMAFTPEADLLVAGPVREGGYALKRITPAGALADFNVSLSRTPDGLWVGPEGMLYLAEARTGQPAIMRRLSSDGKPAGESALRLAGGGFLDSIQGLTFDSQGRAIVAGKGYNAANQRVTGLFVF